MRARMGDCDRQKIVMAGLVPAIHAVGQERAAKQEILKVVRGFRAPPQLNRVDARDKPGHDGRLSNRPKVGAYGSAIPAEIVRPSSS